ncbi:zinc finger protein 37-like isoform X2 [Leguminivora glycinivorella]|uniref:zinc finger protein 37-like isoform X2 n=1 Tax=Leguminivora glycinivorella TaxID=1035111 RepID=UPI00200F923C|nr:zinc finger protein 37-like isoform X2 [Leguminivora glycinivorella]
MDPCCCCLRRPPDKDLTTPYTHRGKTEIFYDMFKECFKIDLVLGGSGSCGICWACVGRLRDASDFKLQVQRSQAELRAALLNIDTAVKSEQADSAYDNSVFEVPSISSSDEKLAEKSEVTKEETNELKVEDTCNTETDDVMSEDDYTAEFAPAAAQLAMTCRVQLQRLRPEQLLRRQTNPYACEHCTTTFTNKDVLTAHIQQTHASSEQLLLDNSYVKMFTNKDVLSTNIQTHLSSAHSQLDNSCVKMLSSEQSPLDNSSVKTFFKCSNCGYMCTDKSRLVLHQAKHEAKKLQGIQECGECGYECTQEREFQDHMLTHRDHSATDKSRGLHQAEHKAKELHECGECGYQCTQKREFQDHMLTHRAHNSDKPYKCDHCGYATCSKYRLLAHLGKMY